MAITTYAKDRRSTRVFQRIRLVVAGKTSDRRRFRETSETIVINAHGCLLYMKQEVSMETMLVITNPFTQEDQECRVVYLGDDSSEKGQRIGLEFLTPAPHFWGVEFTELDWAKSATPPSVSTN
jgi:hypothetical protein